MIDNKGYVFNKYGQEEELPPEINTFCSFICHHVGGFKMGNYHIGLVSAEKIKGKWKIHIDIDENEEEDV